MKTLSYGKGDIVISEVLNANVSSLKQPDGEYYDWIELHNTTGSPISLAGYALSNNAKNPANKCRRLGNCWGNGLKPCYPMET